MDWKLLILMGFLISTGLKAQKNTPAQYIYRSGNDLIISDQERKDGTIYKIEIIRLPEINPNDPELERLKKLGKVYTEEIKNKGLKALMIGDYNKEEAMTLAKKIRDMGFPDTKVILYKNGLRSGSL